MFSVVLEARLERRYKKLVRSHMMSSDLLSSGIKSSLDGCEAFSQTQAAWRFFNNDRCSLEALMQPILASGKKQTKDLCHEYALIAHDWSGLSYKSHHSKIERYGIHNEQDLGYELQSSLLLSDIHGGPISPVAVNLVSKTKVLSTYSSVINRTETHLNELAKRVDYIEGCGFEKECVHIIDREGDSAHFMRALEGKKWLLRCKANSHITYAGKSMRTDQLAKQLAYTKTREVSYAGRIVDQHLSEAAIHIARPGSTNKGLDGLKQKIAGKSLSARLIVSKIVDKEGKVLSWWYLLTNVQDRDMADIALWYYWRWGIESFFKLLKSAGMHLENWQQESVEAIARRILVACMACVFVWQIAESKGPEAGELRNLLIRLSGRQMKYGVSFTRPALLAGLCSLLNTLDLLRDYDGDDLKNMLQKILKTQLV